MPGVAHGFLLAIPGKIRDNMITDKKTPDGFPLCGTEPGSKAAGGRKGRYRRMNKRTRKIAKVFRKWLVIIIFAIFAVSMGASWIYQTQKVQYNAVNLLQINIQDVRQDVIDASDKTLLALTEEIASVLNRRRDSAASEDLLTLQSYYDVAEISVIDKRGIIVACTDPTYINYDMNSGEQSREFLRLLDGTTHSYVQSYQPMSYDSSIYRKYAGVVLKDGSFVQVSYDAERFQKDIDEHIVGVTRNRHVGENGSVIIANKSGIIVSDRNGDDGKALDVTGLTINPETMQPDTVFKGTIYGHESYVMYTAAEGYIILAEVPSIELMISRNASVLWTSVAEILVFLAMSILIVILLRRLVIQNIDSVNGSLSRITGGNLNEEVNVRNSEEFSSLSDDINSTVKTLKKYIADASARIDQELEFAKVIQLSAMPRVFPERPEFEIFASIDPAKEVGGDFYDFFQVDNDHMALVIADVSGKGIPAAMFMMTAKTLIKNRTQPGESLEDILRDVNNQLCDGNEAEMFVTVWMAIIEISTGKGVAVNAGHEHPVLRRANGTYELVKYRHGPAVATYENIRFRQHSFELFPGDSLFVYTDGVPEAHNARSEMYDAERMLAVLNSNPDAALRDQLEAMRADIDAFVGEAPQFDDITMLAFRYHGIEVKNPEEITLEATISNMPVIMDMVVRKLDEIKCPLHTARQVRIAVEELYVNIAHYAYAPNTGSMTLRVETVKDPAAIICTFTDSGIPYNPLEKPDPDLTLPVAEKPIGGLGIYMVKKSMDEVTYRYEEGKNILTIRKNIPQEQ